MVAFLIIGLAQLGSLYITAPYQNPFQWIAAAAQIFFSFVVAAFFNYLYKQAKPTLSDSSAQDIEAAFAEFNKKQA